MEGWMVGLTEGERKMVPLYRSIDELMGLWVYGWINRFIEG